MAATFGQPPSNPLLVPELLGRVISFLDRPVDLVRCSLVNSTWMIPALQTLYRGSMNDMRFCTPDLTVLDSLFVQSEEHFAQSEEHFAQYTGYVKHLTLAAKQPMHPYEIYYLYDGCDSHTTYDYDAPYFRFVSYDYRVPYLVSVDEMEKIFDILRGRTGAALLLRPKGKGPISLAIPTVLVYEDKPSIPYLRDLILHPDLRSITIDQMYCGLLRSGLHSELYTPRLSNLAAFSIYQIEGPMMIDDLSVCLEHCDLKLFHLDLFEQLPGLSQKEMEPLLRRLWQHRNLQVLALRTDCDDTTLGGLCSELEVQSQMPCWPKLGALYLTEIDDYWLQTLPYLEQLQILELQGVRIAELGTFETIADSISCCHSLCSLDLSVDDFEDPELLPIIADGCPLLRRFFVQLHNPSGELIGDQFSRSVQALPHLELLSFHVPFHMTASELRVLAESCPRLKLLALKRARLSISMKSLLATPPLSSLRVMELDQVQFNEHHRSIEAGGLERVAREWKRIFPQIQHPPCPNDVAEPKLDLEGNASILSTENRYQTTSTSTSYPSPSHPSKQLWKLLGYSSKDTSDLAFRLNHKWQTDFEIELFGWPVVVMSAYHHPEKYYDPDT